MGGSHRPPALGVVCGDPTHQTSHFQGNKNFLVGAWGLLTQRDGLAGDRTAAGFSLQYPNDVWEATLNYKRIGDGFDPSVGFVSRTGVQLWSSRVAYTYRPGWSWLRQMLHEFEPQLVVDNAGRWLQPGSYHWRRYRLEADLAAKRPVSGRATWWFGSFYGGTLHQLTLRAQLNPFPGASFELSQERDIGRLPAGNSTEQLFGARANVYFSPDLQLSSFVQYDNDSRLLGTNTRLRWTFDPLGDLFVVYNHNLLDRTDRWVLESNQLLLKVQYAVRM